MLDLFSKVRKNEKYMYCVCNMLEDQIRRKRIRLVCSLLLSIRMEKRYVKLETHTLVKENQSDTSRIFQREEEKMVDRRVVCVEVRSLFTVAVQTRERKRRRGEKRKIVIPQHFESSLLSSLMCSRS